MKNDRAQPNPNLQRVLTTAARIALAVVTLIAATTPTAHARRFFPPRVPAALEVPAGNRPFLEGHAIGTQDYICLSSESGYGWAFFGPQATLFDHDRKQITTHFLSANPFEAATPRATWQHSRDTSAVWAVAIASSDNSRFVKAGAIPWLLLQVVGAEDGPYHGDRLIRTTFIQRLNTRGGVAPSTGCAVATDVGKKALVPYQADYFFFKHGDADRDDDY